MPKTVDARVEDARPEAETRPLEVEAAAGSPGLAEVLRKAKAASPEHRIELRDPIAAYGAPAIEAVRPWLQDPRLAAFAVRVIDRAGCAGESDLATQTLRAAKSHAPANVAPDIEWALQHLRAVSRPDLEPAPTPVPTQPRPVLRRPSPRADRRSHRA